MIQSKLYRLDTADIQWQVAHLYEHLVIRGFYNSLQANNNSSEIISWIEGETFEEVLFIEALFYTRELSEMFEQFLSSIPEFSNTDIEHAIATIEAEERIKLTITDTDELQDTLDILRHRPWNSTSPTDKSDINDIITEKEDVDSYHDITVTAHTKKLTTEEQKLYLRLKILIIELIAKSLTPLAGVYQGENSDIVSSGDDLAYISHYATNKKISMEDIEQALHTALGVDEQSLQQVIKIHFTVFAQEPSWQGMPIDYYRQTGIITTNQEIAELATLERAMSILKKTSLHVRPITPEDKKYFK